jgi:hypothetical protein
MLRTCWPMVKNFKCSYKLNVMARCLCTYGACRETMSLNLLRRDDGKLAYIHNHHTPIRGDGGDRAERRSHSNVWLQVTWRVTTRHLLRTIYIRIHSQAFATAMINNDGATHLLRYPRRIHECCQISAAKIFSCSIVYDVSSCSDHDSTYSIRYCCYLWR